MILSRLYILVALIAAPYSASAANLEEPTAIYASTRLQPVAMSPLEFNEENKMAVGMVGAGATGLIGAHLQFYPGPDFAIGIGYGGSRDLKAFNVYFRELLTNNTFSFYWTAGYARWWNNSGKPITSTTPDFLGDKFLSDSEKASGTFVEHLLYPGIGGEFYNFSGAFAGMTFYAEGLLMTDLGSFRVNPTLGMGAFYHF